MPQEHFTTLTPPSPALAAALGRETPEPEDRARSESKAYIGAKIIKARPMTRDGFAVIMGRPVENREDEPGYLVEYPDNYQSWSPKHVFEQAYRPISEGEKRLI